jgi:hypothetical protein
MCQVGDRISVDGSTFVVVQVRDSDLHESEGRKNLAEEYRRDGVADLVCKKRLRGGRFLLRERADGSIIEYIPRMK